MFLGTFLQQDIALIWMQLEDDTRTSPVSVGRGKRTRHRRGQAWACRKSRSKCKEDGNAEELQQRHFHVCCVSKHHVVSTQRCENAKDNLIVLLFSVLLCCRTVLVGEQQAYVICVPEHDENLKFGGHDITYSTWNWYIHKCNVCRTVLSNNVHVCMD